MWWLKCFGSVLILAGCAALGWQQGVLLRRRVHMLREMAQSLILFKSLTGTYRLPLNMVFSRISHQTQKPVSDFYKKLSESFSQRENPAGEVLWRQTVGDMGDVFGKEDRALLEGLGNFIGIQDVKIQKAAVDDCIQEIRERLRFLEEERPAKEKIYRIVSLTIGGFLVILLL